MDEKQGLSAPTKRDSKQIIEELPQLRQASRGGRYFLARCFNIIRFKRITQSPHS